MERITLITVLVALMMMMSNAVPLAGNEEITKDITQMTKLEFTQALRKDYEGFAKAAGYKDSQIKPAVDFVYAFADSHESLGGLKSMLADNCKMLNDDGIMFEFEDKEMPEQKWSELTDAKMTEKFKYLFEFTRRDDEIPFFKAIKNFCVLFLDPEERKEIENWAKEAGIKEEEIPAAVDMEMRLRTTDSIRERDDIMFKHLDDLGKKNYMILPELTAAENEKLETLKGKDAIDNANFWAEVYNRSTGPDHMKAMKNVFALAYEARKPKNTA